MYYPLSLVLHNSLATQKRAIHRDPSTKSQKLVRELISGVRRNDYYFNRRPPYKYRIWTIAFCQIVRKKVYNKKMIDTINKAFRYSFRNDRSLRLDWKDVVLALLAKHPTRNPWVYDL